MKELKAGTKVYLKRKDIYYPYFLVGFNSNGEPIIEFRVNDGNTKAYTAVNPRRLYTVEEVEGITESPM